MTQLSGVLDQAYTQKQQTCAICGGHDLHDTKYLDKWNVGFFENKSISICLKCGFGQISPKIDNNIIQDYYENTYRNKNSPMHIDFNRSKLNMSSLDYRSISQLLLGAQYLNSGEEVRFLDIGPGFGSSFISARQILGNVILFAIESNHDAKKFYARNLDNIYICEHLSEIKDKIDIVLMSHSLEHFDIDDMPEFFHHMHGVLSDNGIVIIEVPHVDLRKTAILNYRFSDTPHLSFFSSESLRLLIDKLDFELSFMNTVGPLISDYFSREANENRCLDPQARKCISTSARINRLARKSVKQTAKRIGLFDYVYKVSEALKCPNHFYDDINFKYGGDRNLLRCVIKKRYSDTR